MQEQYKGCYGSDTLFCRIRHLGYAYNLFIDTLLDRLPLKPIIKAAEWLNKKLHIGD